MSIIDRVNVHGSPYELADATVRAILPEKEDTINKVTSVSSSSTDTQYPSAKATYDIIGSEKSTASVVGKILQFDSIIIPPVEPLNFTPVSGTTTLGFYIDGELETTPVLYYSLNKTDWTQYTFGTTITVLEGQTCYQKGDNNSFSEFITEGEESLEEQWNYIYFDSDAAVYARGNLMTLLDSTGASTTIPTGYCFAGLFANTLIASAPNVPAVELKQGCYAHLFENCTHLTAAPNLPATTLASDCYNSMFYGCSSLTSTPALPATTLEYGCYYKMFYGCTSLALPPRVIPATTFADYCCYAMFRKCASLLESPELMATTLGDNCCSYMFAGCTSLTTASELLATTLGSRCYYYMFQGCRSLSTAPSILPATTLAYDCYSCMFYNCTSLTTPPVLPATTLLRNCYQRMFYGCTSLTIAPALPATTLADYCYYNMFDGCTSLTTVPVLPATTLTRECYAQMFSYCTSLTTAPALPATTLAFYCYDSMFEGCTSLQVWSSSGTGHDKAWRIPTSGTASSYVSQRWMFWGCPGSYSSAGSVSLNTTFYTQNTPIS